MSEHTERPKALGCEDWEALLVDKMDGTLAPEEEARFAAHAAECQACSTLLEEAFRGQEWMKLLGGHAPAAPPELLGRILARTQGASASLPGAGIGPLGIVPVPLSARWGIHSLPHQAAQHARLIMTAGMAFFSVALTLSVAGVRLHSVHAAELRPQAVQADVTRSFYGTKKQVVSFYDNLRLVYEVESKMQELRGNGDDGAAQHEPAKPVSSAPPAKPKGHAASGSPAPEGQHPAQDAETRGWPVTANLVLPGPAPAHLAPIQLLATRRGATSQKRNSL